MRLHPAAAAAGIVLVTLESIGSTNSEALARAQDGVAGPLWVVSAQQTAGRGRQGRSWMSAPGNLFATLLLTGPCEPRDAPQLSFVAALAAHDALCAAAPHLATTLRLKWPNDVLCDWAKLAGILIEGDGRAVAIGVGVNCVSHPGDMPYPATDLAAQGAPVAAADVFTALSHAMLVRLTQWDRGAQFVAIRAAWLARGASVGEPVRARLPHGDVVGHFETLDDAGRLMLRLANGQTTAIAAGDVFPLDVAAAAEAV